MRKKKYYWGCFLLSVLVVCRCVLTLQDAQAYVSSQALIHFSSEVEIRERIGYRLGELLVADFRSKEHIIATFFSPQWTPEAIQPRSILMIYRVEKDEILPIFVREFREVSMYGLEVRNIDGDWDNEIIVTWGTGGRSPAESGIGIFNFKNGQIIPVEVIPQIPSDSSKIANFVPGARLADLEGDKVYELLVKDTTFYTAYTFPTPLCPVAWRVFSLKNGRYEEDSSSFPGYYDREIHEIEQDIVGPCGFITGAISLYLNYYYKGEAEKGFQRFHQLVMSDECIKDWGFYEQELGVPISSLIEDLLYRYPVEKGMSNR